MSTHINSNLTCKHQHNFWEDWREGAHVFLIFFYILYIQHNRAKLNRQEIISSVSSKMMALHLCVMVAIHYRTLWYDTDPISCYGNRKTLCHNQTVSGVWIQRVLFPSDIRHLIANEIKYMVHPSLVIVSKTDGKLASNKLRLLWAQYIVIFLHIIRDIIFVFCSFILAPTR